MNNTPRPTFTRPSANPGLKVEFERNKILKAFPKKIYSANELEVEYVKDSYADKKVTAYTKSVLGAVVLWEKEAYDAIGQWTDEDVKQRLLEIVGQ